MNQSIVLGIGTGRCGLRSLAKILNRQPETQSSYEEPPLLPWKLSDAERVVRERFARFRRNSRGRILCDVASFYLPCLEVAIAAEADIRIIALRRPREEVVVSFCEWLDQSFPLPTNHWADRPAPGWHHDPLRTRTFPQYDTQNREEGIRRYWDEYYQRVEELRRRYPQQIRLFDTYEALNTPAGLQDLLSFAGVAAERQIADAGTHVNDPPERPKRRWARRSGGNPMDPKRCAILIPFGSSIIPPCERALEELERRGYDVRRVGGYAAIDQGRNQMATDALLDGYEETLWIDADVDFHPDSVDRLRSHGLPIVCGIYPQKGKRALASHILPGTPKIVFGKEGGLIEVLYAGAGFLHVRREVYLAIQKRQQLPMCNERFRAPMIPFFHSMVHPCEDGHWYLAEDYAFCQRARACGFKIMADTTIRLWHVGNHAYGWEDAGRDLERFETFVLNVGPDADPPEARGDDQQSAVAELARRHPWPATKPDVPPFPQPGWLFPGTREMLARCVPSAVRLIVELGSWTGRSTRHLATLAPQATIIAIDHWQGSPEHQADPELARVLPRLYETFLSECWTYRERIVPLKTDSRDGLHRVAEAGLRPDLVYIDADHAFEAVLADVQSSVELFPSAIIVGDDWDWDGVRAAVETVVAARGFKVETYGTGWRIIR